MVAICGSIECRLFFAIFDELPDWHWNECDLPESLDPDTADFRAMIDAQEAFLWASYLGESA